MTIEGKEMVNRKLTTTASSGKFSPPFALRVLMREAEELPLFTVTRCRSLAPIFTALSLVALIAISGCSIKTTRKIDIPQGIRQAETASFDDLLGIIRRDDGINTLSSNGMELRFTSLRKMAVGKIEQFRPFDGYILLKRPDSIRFVLLVPVVSSTMLDVLSVGDKLSAWSPQEHKFYEGKSSAKQLIVEDPAGEKELSIPRGAHIFEAILPQSADFEAPGAWVSLDEQMDAKASYYVLTFLKQGNPPRIYTIRKIWIERAGLTIARQQLFGNEGELASDIVYSNEAQFDGFLLPLQMHIDRPADGYSLDLKFRSWKPNNPEVGEASFVLQPHPEDQIIHIRDKGRSSGQ